jgi:hypothetical protein
MFFLLWMARGEKIGNYSLINVRKVQWVLLIAEVARGRFEKMGHLTNFSGRGQRNKRMKIETKNGECYEK